MKRFKLISILSLFLLSGCSLFNNDITLEARYVKKSSPEELTTGETIKYGERFDFDHFVLYKVSNGSKTLLTRDYAVRLTGTEGLTEEMFNSDKPEVGQYDFIFEYKSKTAAISFSVNPTSTMPEDVSMSVHDWDFLGDKIQPTFTNYTPGPNASITYYLANEEGRTYGVLNFSDGKPIEEIPGNYKIKAEIYDKHYNGAILWCDFEINKVDFPSDILEVYNTNFNYTFNINYFTVGGYSLSTPKVRYIHTQRDLNVPQENFFLSWKDESELISTDEIAKHKVVLHTDCFNDFEYEVDVSVSKLEVDEPYGICIDNDPLQVESIKYDGNEHMISIRHKAYSGQYEINEEKSDIKGTEKGTYKVVIQLVDKTNLRWNTTHDDRDLTYYWYIT